MSAPGRDEPSRDAPPREQPPVVVTRGPDAPAVYVARHAGAVAHAATARAALAAVGRPAVVDPTGIAGVLWRGAPVDAHLPLDGVVGVPAGGSAELRGDGVVMTGPATDAAPSDLALLEARLLAEVRGPAFAVLTRGAHGSLALLALRRLADEPEGDALTIHWPGAPERDVTEAGRTARALHARHHVLRPDADEPEAALARWCATCDLPSLEDFRAMLVDAALARAGVARAATSAGAPALFGVGEPFASVAHGGWRLALRSRPPRVPPDAFDLAGQRAVERAALARVPLHAAQVALALLPAGTRAALSTAGPRPPDGTPGLASRAAAVAEAALRALSDGELRAPSPRTWRPYLAAPVVAAVRGLPPRARFGRLGSGGPLRSWLRRAHGWVNRAPAEGFHVTLDRWLRGPWAGWLARTLAPGRLAAQGLWKPEGVARLVASWQASATAEAARAVFVVAATVAWVDRVRGTDP